MPRSERSIISVVLIFVAAFSSAAAADISIGIERSASGTCRIAVSILGDDDGRTEIRLPNEWGGQRELYRAVKNLTVAGADAKIVDSDEPHIKTILHKPSEPITLTYDLVQDFPGKLKNSVRYRPVVSDEHIHWIGSTVWVLPSWEDTKPLDIEVEWRGLPDSWSVANSFSFQKRKVRFKRDIRSLRSSIWVAGDFRIVGSSANGKPVYLAVRGEWKFSDNELADIVGRMIEAQRSFWNDDSEDHYLVTLVPIFEGPNALSIGGTGLRDSFSLFATENATIGRLRSILAHEYAHNWIPGKLGRMPKDERSMYWFSEGFTEYYTHLLLFRAGLITREEMIGEYNALIREYYLSPVRTEPNERIIRDFWSDQSVQRLPYLRGFLLALNWNAAIRKASGGKRSLDDVMFELLRTSENGTRELSPSLLTGQISKHIGKDISGEFDRHITNGELMVPAADALGNDLELRTDEIRVFELGFDIQHLLKEKEFIGIKENTAAFDAGIRNGQKLVGGISVSLGDTSKEVALTVSDADGTKAVSYLPIARERLKVPQFLKKQDR